MNPNSVSARAVAPACPGAPSRWMRGCVIGVAGRVIPASDRSAGKIPPKGWVQCGMGAAKDSFTCGTIIFGQVAAVGQLALTAATLGSSMAGTAGASAVQNAGKLSPIDEKFTPSWRPLIQPPRPLLQHYRPRRQHTILKNLLKLPTRIDTAKKTGEAATTRALAFHEFWHSSFVKTGRCAGQLRRVGNDRGLYVPEMQQVRRARGAVICDRRDDRDFQFHHA